ncbi:hypothetical protein ABIB82_002420 [Bradyrhizobium sp. i1.8.4]
MSDYPKPPYPDQKQSMPGVTARMNPHPDHGESSYRGSGKLAGKRAVITGGDSGIGRAVAIAYAREGADVLISYLNEHDDAHEVKALVQAEGRRALLVAGDLRSPEHCRAVIERAVEDFGGLDILVNNAAHQASFKDIADISDEGVAADLRRQYPRDVLSGKGGGAAYAARQRDHKHGVDQFGHAESDSAGLCHDQGRDTEFYRRTCADAGRERHSRECRRAGADLDSADPVDITRRVSEAFWQAGSAEASRPTGRACDGLRHARRSALELYVWDNGRGHRRKAVHLGP